ncbi:DNA replication/repair protein RecF [Alicyclobacillaceae bacterium I2511]|nr:DNA replication/repair protein RecF [Alicyclobacillaceae bacterium I2511]
MHIEKLILQQFRNYKNQLLTLHPHLNVLTGDNAQGKTNVLEAVYYLAVGKSHRTNHDMDLIQQGQTMAQLQVVISREEREQELVLQLRGHTKTARINGIVQSKMTDFIGRLQVVLFAPEDLSLVKGGPSVRRRFIDIELGQSQPAYLYHLGQYARTLQQRNALLKQFAHGTRDEEYLSVFDQPLAEHGAQVWLRRSRFLLRMSELVQHTYATLSSSREHLTLDYDCSLPGVDLLHNSTSVTALSEAFQNALRQKHELDCRQGHTSLGPHRDDLLFFLDGQNVQSYASQGQQRTIVLALRLAEIDLLREEAGEYPVLLLDDVLSELDNQRQQNLVLAMSEKVQIILTTANFIQLPKTMTQQARLFQVCSGIISGEG